jgi:hypothetical protein
MHPLIRPGSVARAAAGKNGGIVYHAINPEVE